MGQNESKWVKMGQNVPCPLSPVPRSPLQLPYKVCCQIATTETDTLRTHYRFLYRIGYKEGYKKGLNKRLPMLGPGPILTHFDPF